MRIKHFLSLFVLAYASDVMAESACFKNGEKFGALAKKGGEKLVEYYQKSQDFYLCAAKEGDALAGFYAVQLSESGWANEIDQTEIIRLLTVAANASVPSSALALANKYCDFSSCTNPKEAKLWLIKSVLLGESVGANELGAFYERGYEGTKLLDKAAACFKLSAELGNELGKENYERVLSQKVLIAPVKCL